jgi:hypothetical protein
MRIKMNETLRLRVYLLLWFGGIPLVVLFIAYVGPLLPFWAIILISFGLMSLLAGAIIKVLD